MSIPTLIDVSLDQTLERLKELAQLEADWDSYGAEPVSSVAFVTAFKLIAIVKERLSNKVEEPLPSFIAPLADGGLQLEWSGTRGDLEVEIGADGYFSCVLIEGEGTNRKIERKNQSSLEDVLNLVSKFIIS